MHRTKTTTWASMNCSPICQATSITRVLIRAPRGGVWGGVAQRKRPTPLTATRVLFGAMWQASLIWRMVSEMKRLKVYPHQWLKENLCGKYQLDYFFLYSLSKVDTTLSNKKMNYFSSDIIFRHLKKISSLLSDIFLSDKVFCTKQNIHFIQITTLRPAYYSFAAIKAAKAVYCFHD